MDTVNADNIGVLLKKWFAKSIFESPSEFNETEFNKDVLSVFKYDYERYFPNEEKLISTKLTSRLELIGILLYRFSNKFYLENRITEADFCSLLGRFLSGFEIYYSATIGKGLKINHGLGTVIGARTVIGDNALIHQGVTFGDKNGGRPIIGNAVVVYAGAKILGNTLIGDNVTIAANAVCFINVPSNSTVVGVPARIL